MYTKNTWQSGDIITKVKLDNIEDGIYDNSYVKVIYFADTEDDDTFTCDHTFDQITAWINAVPAGKGYALMAYVDDKYEGLACTAGLAYRDFDADHDYAVSGYHFIGYSKLVNDTINYWDISIDNTNAVTISYGGGIM